MSILKHDVEFNHVMLHVVAWVKAKQLTSGYIPLKIIHLLISLSCRLLGISKDRDILAKSFVAFITFLPTWIMLSIYYVLLLTICKIKTFFSFLQQNWSERKITIFLEICLMAMNNDLKIVRFLCDVNCGSVNKNNSFSIQCLLNSKACRYTKFKNSCLFLD